MSKNHLSFKKKLKIKNIADLELFIRVADSGGLSAAAQLMDLSPAVASASLKRLEKDLGVLLFIRSTRSLRLTPEGERLLTRSRPLLQEFLEIETEVSASQSVIGGEVSISLPSDLGRNIIMPWLDEFQSSYPELEFRLQLSDRMADIYREPVDIAIRYCKPADSSMVALPLVSDNYRVLCASPQYLQRTSVPIHPETLVNHNCLCFRVGGNLYNRWRFKKGNENLEIEVKGNRTADDSDAVRYWAISGHGICYRSWLDVAEDVMAGRLEVLCSDWLGEEVPLNIICADRRQLSPKIRLLKDHLQERFRSYCLSFGKK